MLLARAGNANVATDGAAITFTCCCCVVAAVFVVDYALCICFDLFRSQHNKATTSVSLPLSHFLGATKNACDFEGDLKAINRFCPLAAAATRPITRRFCIKFA